MSEEPRVPPPAEAIDDPSIPLLTDRIFLPAVELDTALPTLPAPGAPATAEPEKESVEADAQAAGPEREVAAVEAEPAIEAELDGDLVAASDADFDALLSAEQPPEAGDALAEAAKAATAEAPAAPAPVSEMPPVAAETADAGPAAASAAAQLAVQAQAEALRAAVLQRVANHLPEQLHATVRDLMQPAIEQAMAKLGEEAEVALRITLQELVEQALREELARRRGDGSAG